MKNIKYLFTYLLLVLTLGVSAQTVNRLEVDTVVGAAGKVVNIPIAMTNDNEIVAVQFNLHLPFAKPAGDPVLVSERVNGHAVSVRSLGNNTYMVVIVSMENRALRGSAGTLLTFPMQVDAGAQADESYDVTISDAVLSMRSGKNVVNSNVNGKYIVKRVPTPDLIVENVTFQEKSISPDQNITINWVVKNDGNELTGDGWNENIYLQGSNGKKVHLGKVYSDAKLAAGVNLPRSATFKLPKLLGIDGDVEGVVTVVPSAKTGELKTDQVNNTGVSKESCQLVKKMYLTSDSKALKEGDTSPLRFRLSRSGFWDFDEKFLINTNHENRLTHPLSVTIPQGQSAVYFYVSALNNEVTNDYLSETLTVESKSGYGQISYNVDIHDDELTELSIECDKTEITEGDSLTLRITRQRFTVADTINLTCEKASHFEYPKQIVFLENEKSKDVLVKSIDDNRADVDYTVAFYASAIQYTKAEQLVIVKDNDIPDISLELSPTEINEGAGLTAIMATLKRTSALNSRITIKLEDNSLGKLYCSTRTIVLEKGMKEAQFSVGVVDNSLVEPTAEYELTAAVYISSCNCSGSSTNKGKVTKKITVLDNDGPSLGLTMETPTIQEGDQNGIHLTVSHNVVSSQAVLVRLSSEDSSVEMPSQVTIPAGHKEVRVPIKVKANDIEGDSRTVVVNAVCEGFTNASCWLMISDQTLPDAYFADFAVNTFSLEVGTPLVAKVDIANMGIRELPAGTEIGYYIEGVLEPIGYFVIPTVIAAKSHMVLEHTLNLPSRLGDLRIYAKVDPKEKVRECLKVNNQSKVLTINLAPAYTVTAQVDQKVVSSSTPVTISGKAVGSKIANVPVEVYIINEGYRYVVQTTTDNTGKYAIKWTPDENQMGSFVVGACYPGVGDRQSMDVFNIYGLRRANAQLLKCETIVGEQYDGAIIVENPSSIDLHNVRVEIVESPQNCTLQFEPVRVLKGASRASLLYHINGSAPSAGTDWEKVRLRISSNEGAELTMNMYYYCRSAKAKLCASVNRIETAMLKGQSRDYSFTISNVGKGETGVISLSLPSNQTWLTAVTPLKMPSLKSGESATVILRMSPSDDMPLNVPVTARLGINVENGDGLPLSLRSEVVSDRIGTLLIDVCDENTYYTAEAPHVAGAQVVVKHPKTGVLITQGVTDSTGVLKLNLPEGYYTVGISADNHESFRENILVDPGNTTKRVVNLSLQSIEVSWNVKETEVEDVYDIVTTVKYETNVPVPVVDVILPKALPIEQIKSEGSCIINAILTNKGLINAEDVSLNLGKTEGLEFEYLYENGFTLAPSQSIMIPVKVRLAQNTSSQVVQTKAVPTIGCVVDAFIDWFWNCGPDRKYTRTSYPIQAEHCVNHLPSVPVDIPPVRPEPPHIIKPPYIEIGPPSGPSDDDVTEYPDFPDWKLPVIESTVDECDPCLSEKLKTISKCAVRWIPYFGTILDTEEILVKVYNEVTDNNDDGLSFDDYLDNTPDDVPKKWHYEVRKYYKFTKKLLGFTSKLECIWSALLPCDYIVTPNSTTLSNLKKKANPYGENLPNYVVAYLDVIQKCVDVAEAEKGLYLELMGDSCWLYNIPDEQENVTFGEAFDKWKEEGMIDDDLLRSAKPTTITDEQLNQLIARWRNTVAKNHADGNYVHQERLNECLLVIGNLEVEANLAGFREKKDWYMNAEEIFQKELKGNSGSVCSTVSLQINQRMTMTRQAFIGTLTVYNGNEQKAMTDVKLSLEVTNSRGELATSHEMQINLKELKKFEGALSMTDGWTLSGRETGQAIIQFIPTKYAALTTPEDYFFGGTLTYVDPYTGLEVVRDLYPVKLTVNPAPNLDLTYFMQRDIMGDNALTTDVVEPMVPAEFSLLINNTGYGDATNVNITTQQPKIIDNEKGLLIDFEILSSQVNGKDYTLALGGSVGADFGRITAHSTACAQWLLQSSLLGHFTEYDVKATHVTSYGNKDLSLLNEVTIHELIHSLRIPDQSGENLIGFLVNDITDSYDTPDALYKSDGSVYNVLVVDEFSSEVSKLSSNTFKLNLHTEQSAWHYGSIVDPTAGKAKLTKVVRERDGKEIPLNNFWQTSYTLKDGKEPLQENLLHFADSLVLSSHGNSYELVFESYSENPLAVKAIRGLEAENNLQIRPVQKVQVTFNKPIRPATFTPADLKLTCQGQSVDLSAVTLAHIDDCNFDICFGDSITDAEGYYVLTVRTDDVMDTEGFKGQMGKNADWIYFYDGLLTLRTEAYPLHAGSVAITKEPKKVQMKNRLLAQQAQNEGFDEMKVIYDEPVTVVARAAKGYRFKGWYLGDELLSTDSAYTTACMDHTLLKAEFVPISCNVTVKETDYGKVTGVGTGKYDFGVELKLTAVPNPGYVLSGWMLNGVTTSVGSDNTYLLKVEGDVEVKAMFTLLASTDALGDVNNDGLITIFDVSLLRDYILGNVAEGFHKENADVNGDGMITIVDCALLLDEILKTNNNEK